MCVNTRVSLENDRRPQLTSVILNNDNERFSRSGTSLYQSAEDTRVHSEQNWM